MDYRLLPLTEQDEPFLKELYFEACKQEFLPLGLPEAALAQLLEMQYRAQKSGYAQQFPNLESSVVWVGPYRVGRMLVSADAAAIQLVDIALLEAFRGQGIGRKLIESLCRRALQAGVPLRLSVRQENRAMKLYTRLGFVRCGGEGSNVAMEWGGTTAQQTTGDDSVHEVGPVEAGPNGAYFRSICGTRAIIQKGAIERVVLKIASIRKLRPNRDPGVSIGDSFALTFEGDSSAMLAQGIYNFEFDDGYRLDIFLVPIGAANGIATYESIFNRMSRPTPVME